MMMNIFLENDWSWIFNHCQREDKTELQRKVLLACGYSWGLPVLLSCATAIVQFADPSFMSVPGDSDNDDYDDYVDYVDYDDYDDYDDYVDYDGHGQIPPDIGVFSCFLFNHTAKIVWA